MGWPNFSYFELNSDAILALVDENKKIHFGLAPLIWVSSFQRPVYHISTNVFLYLISEYHDHYYECGPGQLLLKNI